MENKKEKKTMVEDVLDFISSNLINGVYKPNDKLPTEFELADQLNVSRNTVREAIKILTYQGIVEIRRADGTYICSEASPKLLNPVIYSLMYYGKSEEMLLELREMIEVGAVLRAIRKRTDEELELMKDAIKELEALCMQKDPDVDEVLQADDKIHDIILSMGNNVLAEEISRIVYKILEKRRKSAIENGKRNGSLMMGGSSHMELYRLIKDRDEENVLQIVPKTFYVGGI